MKVIAAFEVVVGLGIVILWPILLAARQVPEVLAGDRAIWFHLTAEFMLGIALVVSGLVLIIVGDEPSARILAGAALGGITYSAVNCSGYYARGSNWMAVGVFAVLTGLAVTSTTLLLTL